ncbi:serine hydrolase domain-containing protein [Patiriisocius hiemis]|uniref:Serine hydrolase n=1 Tax=Patiriisocius hiemis TaxID=3075604 RepID=A0ABU2YBC7_9FLAO|nr:serine hydrolase [Constantimarinum sp. W242]MDT0554939.1 serine hydrolase [Constantimarinum sp. W242]
MRIHILLIITLLTITSCNAQKSLENYVGGWAGKLEYKNPFQFNIEIITTEEGSTSVFKGKNSITEIPLKAENATYLVGQYKDQLIIRIDTTQTTPIAFVQTGHHLSNIDLNLTSKGNWSGNWNLLIEDSFLPTMYFSLDKQEDNSYSASTFFKEPTYHYMWGQDFKIGHDNFEFRDIRSNLNFNGKLKEQRIDLTLNFLKESTKIELSPLPYEQWLIGDYSESIDNSHSSHFSKLVTDIKNDTLEGTHSVVISQYGEVIFETYFDGFTSSVPHDTRSLSKSFASALVGIAIAEQKLSEEHLPIEEFFENQYPEIDWKEGKDEITIHHLLTMSSGLDAIDFGLNRNSFANEGAYQSQEDWTNHILKAPMIYEPGEKANYGSGNPHLLSPIISSSIDERLEFYIHKKLFAPLSIQNYRIQTNNEDQPYFGGGWYLTPRDIMKFGQLYLNNGIWEEKEILPPHWVNKSFDKYKVLENTIDKNEYGYLFWHKTYNINGKKINSIEARGSGGQYLVVIPEYELIVVITSGNYRNGKGFQPERIIKNYILPEIEK